MSESIRALARALAWAVEEGMSIDGLLSAGELDRLHAVAERRAAWTNDLYEPLRAFAHACFRLPVEEAAVRIDLGDVLGALEGMIEAAGGDDVAAWPTSGEVSAEAVAALGYASISEGIVRLEQRNREGWQEHARHHKALVAQAMAQLPGTSAAIIGAAQINDIPLRALAERYGRLILADIDGHTLEKTVDRVIEDPEQRRRLETLTWDVTGIAALFERRVNEVLGRGDGAEAARDGLLELLDSYRLQAPPRLFPEGRVDTVYSLMIISQLATPLTEHVRRRFEACHPGSALLESRAFHLGLGRFTHRLQHSHIQALLSAGATLVLTGDVTERYTQLGPDGQPRAVSGELPLIGAQRLDELLPLLESEKLAATEWEWPRVVPRRAGETGSLLRVHGVVARARIKR